MDALVGGTQRLPPPVPTAPEPRKSCPAGPPFSCSPAAVPGCSAQPPGPGPAAGGTATALPAACSGAAAACASPPCVPYGRATPVTCEEVSACVRC